MVFGFTKTEHQKSKKKYRRISLIKNFQQIYLTSAREAAISYSNPFLYFLFIFIFCIIHQISNQRHCLKKRKIEKYPTDYTLQQRLLTAFRNTQFEKLISIHKCVLQEVQEYIILKFCVYIEFHVMDTSFDYLFVFVDCGFIST